MDILVPSGEFNRESAIVSPIVNHLIVIPLILAKYNHIQILIYLQNPYFKILIIDNSNPFMCAFRHN